MVRPWRGATLEIDIARGVPSGGAAVSVAVNGILLATNVLPPPGRPDSTPGGTSGATLRVAVTVR
jgi:hypothetical protein